MDIFRNMEIPGNTGNTKNTTIYFCEKCNHKTSHKNNFAKHCQTIKHRQCQLGNTTEIPEIPKIPTLSKNGNKCERCDRHFVTNSGLWKHRKLCANTHTNAMDPKLIDYLKNKDANAKESLSQILDFVKNKDDELRSILIELVKSNNSLLINQTFTNNNTTTNSMVNSNNNNTTFNLQVFLNETCKDAINLSDFIKTVKSSFEDIESIGSLGYVDGTSEVIIKHLNNLAVEKRPIHCTDAKRQTLYIKEDNQWTKEEPDLKRLQMLVDEVQRINLRVLPLWREKHPACLSSNSIYTSTYNNMSQELMGGDCSTLRIQAKDNKIINKIIKEVVIDKQVYIDKK